MGEWLERNRANLATLLVVLVTVAAAIQLQAPRRSALQVVSPAASPVPPSIKVHVVGAVLTPGVYQLAGDARIEDALKAAGGPSENADLATLNLATPLKDGQQVAVPPVGATTPASGSFNSPSGTASPTKLDLNSASQKQLEELPGIGPVTATKVLDYRTKQGRFIAIDELRDAKLVNSSTFERIKGLVEVR